MYCDKNQRLDTFARIIGQWDDSWGRIAIPHDENNVISDRCKDVIQKCADRDHWTMQKIPGLSSGFEDMCYARRKNIPDIDLECFRSTGLTKRFAWHTGRGFDRGDDHERGPGEPEEIMYTKHPNVTHITDVLDTFYNLIDEGSGLLMWSMYTTCGLQQTYKTKKCSSSRDQDCTVSGYKTERSCAL